LIVKLAVAGEIMIFGAVPDRISGVRVPITKLFIVKAIDQFVCVVPLFIIVIVPVPPDADVCVRAKLAFKLKVLTGGTIGVFAAFNTVTAAVNKLSTPFLVSSDISHAKIPPSPLSMAY
jgi:hypothetical protein